VPKLSHYLSLFVIIFLEMHFTVIFLPLEARFFHQCETRSNCTDTRVTRAIKTVQRAVDAVHANDITKKTVQAFSTAASFLHGCQIECMNIVD
jgi:hypothetical protein